MKFTTSIIAAALATISFAAAAVQEPFPDTYTLSFTSLETGTFLGKLALDKVYNGGSTAWYTFPFVPCN